MTLPLSIKLYTVMIELMILWNKNWSLSIKKWIILFYMFFFNVANFILVQWFPSIHYFNEFRWTETQYQCVWKTIPLLYSCCCSLNLYLHNLKQLLHGLEIRWRGLCEQNLCLSNDHILYCIEVNSHFSCKLLSLKNNWNSFLF